MWLCFGRAFDLSYADGFFFQVVVLTTLFLEDRTPILKARVRFCLCKKKLLLSEGNFLRYPSVLGLRVPTLFNLVIRQRGSAAFGRNVSVQD